MDQRVINFGPYLTLTNIDEDICDELLKVGLTNTHDARKDLAGKIQDETKYSRDNVDYFGHKLVPYFQNYFNTLSNHHNEYIEPSFSYFMENMWINVQKEKEYNPIHFHTGHLSFVIYLKVDDPIYKEENMTSSLRPGQIEFIDSIESFHWKEKDRRTMDYLLKPIRSYTHMPQKGEMFIFPAYLAHQVASFNSAGCERISVSGNLIIQDSEVENGKTW